MPSKPAATARSKATGLKNQIPELDLPQLISQVGEVIRALSAEYGPFQEEPRLEPAHEVVFTILSQHTSDINSARAFQLLMERFGTLETVANGDVKSIEEAISPGGLAKVKAPRIKQVLNMILQLNGSLDLSFLREMPLKEAREWLRQLPGIGPKSAGIILSFSLGFPAMAIDTHIYRVCQRLGLIGPKTNVDKAHEILESAVEPGQVQPFHAGFITHGRQVCKAQRPKCGQCVVSVKCPSRDKFSGPSGDNQTVNQNHGNEKHVNQKQAKPPASPVGRKRAPHSIASAGKSLTPNH